MPWAKTNTLDNTIKNGLARGTICKDISPGPPTLPTWRFHINLIMQKKWKVARFLECLNIMQNLSFTWISQALVQGVLPFCWFPEGVGPTTHWSGHVWMRTKGSCTMYLTKICHYRGSYWLETKKKVEKAVSLGLHQINLYIYALVRIPLKKGKRHISKKKKLYQGVILGLYQTNLNVCVLLRSPISGRKRVKYWHS